MKKYLLKTLASVALTLSATVSALAAPDPNFYIFLCLGQSNMEGAAVPEECDYQYVDDRFLMYAAVDNEYLGRKRDAWYVATPPFNNVNSGLTPADWFGRTLTRALPQDVRVGVINVAIGGCRIEMFDPVDNSPALDGAADWLVSAAARYDDSKPYQHLVKCAKKAQEVGVIKGILMHQGESNNGEKDWPQKVKKVYDALIADLGLDPAATPLLAGETLRKEMGGCCSAHNDVIATLPQVIHNAHVVSSEGCPGADDRLHFLPAGYRKLGYNYAKTLLSLWGIDAPEEWVKPAPNPGYLWDGRYMGKHYPPLRVSHTKFADVQPGDIIRVGYTVEESCNEPHPGLIFKDLTDKELLGGGQISFSKDNPGKYTHDIGVTPAMSRQLREGGFALARPGSLVTSLEIVKGDNVGSLERVLWFGDADLSRLSGQQISAPTFADVKVGDELKFYVDGEPALSYDWDTPAVTSKAGGCISLKVDDEALAHLQSTGVLLTGSGSLKKLTH